MTMNSYPWKHQWQQWMATTTVTTHHHGSNNNSRWERKNRERLQLGANAHCTLSPRYIFLFISFIYWLTMFTKDLLDMYRTEMRTMPTPGTTSGYNNRPTQRQRQLMMREGGIMNGKRLQLGSRCIVRWFLGTFFFPFLYTLLLQLFTGSP